MVGFFPFRGINETQLHENILTGIYPKPNNISGELLDLLSKILDINPSKRISIEEILKHPWLNDTDCINNAKNKYKDFSLNLFTKAEKIIYGKMKLNYKKVSKDIQLENFTNKNIDSYYEEENQNDDKKVYETKENNYSQAINLKSPDTSGLFSYPWKVSP